VRDDVPVGVADETSRVVDSDATEHERGPAGERMRVEAEPHPERHQPSGSCRLWRRSYTVTVSQPASRAKASARSKSSPTSCGSCASEARVTPIPRRTHAERSSGSG